MLAMAVTSSGMSSAGELLLIRHGQSTWNAAHRWQGMADAPLSDLGRTQAQMAATTLADLMADLGIGFGAMWSSPLDRARATAEIIAEGLGLGAVSIDDRLREIDAGPWEGLTPTEIEERWPGYLASNRRPEGFEPTEAVAERTLAALADLGRHSREVGAPVAVASHSGIIRTLRSLTGRRGSRVANLEAVWVRPADDGTVELGESLLLIDESILTPGSFVEPR